MIVGYATTQWAGQNRPYLCSIGNVGLSKVHIEQELNASSEVMISPTTGDKYEMVRRFLLLPKEKRARDFFLSITNKTKIQRTRETHVVYLVVRKSDDNLDHPVGSFRGVREAQKFMDYDTRLIDCFLKVPPLYSTFEKPVEDIWEI